MAGEDKRRRQILKDIGKAGAHALFPNDFEYYLITLELVDSQDKTVDYLAFPVTPDSINYNSTDLVNVKKSLGGVTVLDTSTFIPRTLSLSGTFGRRFKLLVKPLDITVGAGQTYGPGGGGETPGADKFQIQARVFTPNIKTGYGTIKLLEAITEKSKGTDKEGKPFKLYLYNPALGHNWLVTVKSLMFQQDYSSSNMMWRYTLELSCVAPMAAVKRFAWTSLVETLAVSVLQRGATKYLSDVKRSL